MVVLAGDTNGHVGSNSVDYDGTHGGYGFGDRNTDSSRILEFADGLNQSSAYVVGSAKSTVDYIMVRQGIKSRFVMSRSSQTKSVCQSINCQ